MSEGASDPGLSRLISEAVTLSENGIVILDAQDRVVFCNLAMAHYFGAPGRDAVIGRTVDEILTLLYHRQAGEDVQGRSLQEWLQHFHSVFRSLPFRSFEIHMTDGRWLLTTEQILQDGAVMIQCTDISRLKTVEAELRQSKLELEFLAMTDELTRLPNRRHFLSCLEAEAQRAVRYESPLSVAMIDLDFFKQINDRLGHHGGDEVLRHFSALLRDQLRNSDFAGRLGGEEFAISFPETEIADACHVIERVRKMLMAEKLDTLAPGFSYSFSCGMACSVQTTHPDGQKLLTWADAALYQAKSSGRNRTCLHAA